MANELTVKSEETIDGIMLDNNSIGYLNYKSLKNKPESDTTLSHSGNFADAKIVGDKFNLIFDKQTQTSLPIKQEFAEKVAEKVSTTLLRSKNYSAGSYTNGAGYSKTGVYIDFSNDVIHTPGFYTTANGEAYFKGDVTATKLTLGNAVKISTNNISGLPDFNTYLKTGVRIGALDDGATGILVTDAGKLTAKKADIQGTFSGSASITSGTIGGCAINNGKLTIPFDHVTGYSVPTKLSGKAGSIDVTTGSINFTTGSIYVGGSTISDDNIYFSRSVSVEKISSIGDIECNGKIKFIDYYEQSVNSGQKRCPIASVGSDGLNIGYMKAKTSSGGTKQIGIKGQWGTEDTNGKPTSNQGVWDSKLQYINIDSTSDIRLKKNIKDSSICALPLVMDMKIRAFDWKETNVHQPLGLVADEIELIDPLLTIGGGYETDGSINIKSINRLLLTEYAIKALQEQQEIINKQQEEISIINYKLGMLFKTIDKLEYSLNTL